MPRSQILAVLIVSSVLLSGCTTTSHDLKALPNPITTQEVHNDARDLTDSEYQEALERIRAEEELAAELLARVEAAENKESRLPKSVEDDSSDTASPRTEQSPIDSDKPSQNIKQEQAFPVGERAYREVSSLFDNSHKFSPDNVIAHQDIEQRIVDDVVSHLSRASSTWDEQYGIIDNFTVYLFRQDSADWGDEMRIANGDRIARGSFVQDVKISSRGPYCGFVYIVHNRVYACLADSGTSQEFLDAVIPHEYFHGITYRLGIDHTNFPIWLAEGLASYVGDVYAMSNHRDINSKARNWYDWNMSQRFGHGTLQSFAPEITMDELRLIYTKLEGYTVGTAQQLIADYNAYLFGSVAAENLIGTFGIDAVMEFVSSVGNGKYWKTAFAEHFNKSVDIFYEDMLTYIQNNYS